MKKIFYILALIVMLSACRDHKEMVKLQYSYSRESDNPSSKMDSILAPFRVHVDSMRTHMYLIGKWKQPNLTLDLKEDGLYSYLYKEKGYNLVNTNILQEKIQWCFTTSTHKPTLLNLRT